MDKVKYLSCIMVKNVKGVLGSITTKLGENDINIEKVTINTINKDETIQKISIYTTGANTIKVMTNIIKTLSGVLDVITFNEKDIIIEKEICLVKLQNRDSGIIKIVNFINELNGKSIFINNEISVYEILSDTTKIDEFSKKISEISSNVDISRSMVLTTI